jgi:FlaA1/EpsC-like NDP-sugar epimerase
MIKRFLLQYSNRFVSGYTILAGDIFIVIISLVLAYIIRFNFDLSDIALWKLPTYLPIVVAISVIAFLVTKSYVGIIRHTSTDDVIRIFKAVLITAIVLIVMNTLILLYKWPLDKVLPLGVVIMHSLITLFLMIFSRLFAKMVWINLMKGNSKSTNVLIYGAGKAGVFTKNALINDLGNDYKVICFVDENPGKIGKTMEGIPVFGPDVLNAKFFVQRRISQVIIAIQHIDPVKKHQIADSCLQFNVGIKNIPPFETWINGEFQVQQIKNVRIEELLQRDPIVLNNSMVSKVNEGRVILVTGAAGSIGSEIARQLMHLPVGKIILLDQAETPLFNLAMNFRHKFTAFDEVAQVVIADISDQRRMEWVFAKFRPQLVYHAAAYKHVPMMEENPEEAIRVNVFGTRILADLARRFEADRFVMISTDKSVNASNVMGASKRLAEIYTQSLTMAQGHKTRFITTRFGNVLGSNGSVIPIFRQQIEEGGPVTVTHPEVTRYFMTIPEACQLVLEAAAMGNGGEIYLFDMGQPVRIVDMARNMIRLSGLQPDKDIRIEYIGLRPGEKLFEELLNSGENNLPTHHPRIMIAKVSPSRHEIVMAQLEQLKNAWETGDDTEMVRIMKQMVPDFRSNNSRYEALDKLSS